MMPLREISPSARDGIVCTVVEGIAYYYLTSAVALFGVWFSDQFVRGVTSVTDVELLSRLARWDGSWYRQVLSVGYTYAPGDRTTIVFFPAYPVVAWWLSSITGLTSEWSLVLVAHACTASAFVTMAAYVRARTARAAPDAVEYTLLAFGLLPTTMFFRMAYAESMLVLLLALVLYGMNRTWPLTVLAVIVGLATATRPVGVALVPPFALYVWRRLGSTRVSTSDPSNESLATVGLGRFAHRGRTERCVRAAPLLVLSCWGLLAFMAFQWIEFGDPLAFAKVEMQWRQRKGEEVSDGRKLIAMATLEPVWATYIPSKPEYWAHYEHHANPIVSLQFANPIYFVSTVVLVFVGWRKKWLNEYELLLSAGLLLIPYVTKSYDNAMASFGRFSAVVLPAYIVMGHLLHRMGPALAAIVLALMAVMLFIYSAMFAAGYRLI